MVSDERNRLKYYLRDPGEIARRCDHLCIFFLPGLKPDSACMVATLPPMGVMCNGYAALCSGLWVVAVR
jgi:hypothetical protein